MKIVTPFLVLAFGAFQLFSQKTIYVNQASNASQPTGTSWNGAFQDLQEAISVAEYGDRIWIAKGVYYPTTSTDRHISFELKNGVSILGGFNGTETSSSQRTPLDNPTRLSGNIGDVSLANDNSVHVAKGKGLDDSTIIDGLIFSDGNSLGVYDFSSDPFGGGLYLIGGPNVTVSRPTISNCSFEKNEVDDSGGAIFIGDVDYEDSVQQVNLINPEIINCTFRENWATNFGGAILKQGETGGLDTFKIQQCEFESNESFLSHGGAVYFSSSVASNIVMTDCVFTNNNSQGGYGGGFCMETSFPGNYHTSIILQSCVFKQNRASEGGGFSLDGKMYDQPGISINLKVIDCVFEENIAKNSYGGAFFIQQVKDATVNAIIKSSKFYRNKAYTYFVSAILASEETTVNTSIEDCYFIDNVHVENPSSICVAFSAGGKKEVHTKINNCVFAYNGSAIFAGAAETAKVTTDITNCTFFRNGNRPFGKRWYPSFNQGSGYYNNMNFKNCIIWEPVPNNGYLFDNNYVNPITGFGFYLDYCSFHPMNPATIPNYTVVLGDSIWIGEYPKFTDTLGLDFRLDKCSFAVNKGSNEAAMEAGLFQDIDGMERIQFSTVDLGAYEQSDSCFGSKIVNPVRLEPLHIFPNPSKDGELRFSLPELAGATGQLSIYNLTGDLLHTQCLQLLKSNYAQIQNLTSGVYFVTIRVENRVFSEKWIVI